MPPPASPSKSGRESALNDTAELAAQNRALQEKIAALTGGRVTTPPPTNGRASTPSSALRLSTGRTSTQGSYSRAPTPSADVERLNGEISLLQAERDAAQIRTTDLEAQLASLQAQLGVVQKSQADAETARADLETARKEHEATTKELDLARREVKNLQESVEDKETQLEALRASLSATEGQAGERTALLESKDAEIKSIEDRLELSKQEREKDKKSWEEERAELNDRVEELRLAGQETIALYEERLSESEQQRYDLEDILEGMQHKLDAATGDTDKEIPVSPKVEQPAAPTTATEIDNETLREQAAHQQTRIQNLEDRLEDVQAAAEREETALRAKIERFREADERRVREMAELRQERDELGRGKDIIARRVEELEEALREERGTLEDARAEVEVLRADVANFSSQQDGRADATLKDLRARVLALEKERDTLEAERDILRNQASAYAVGILVSVDATRSAHVIIQTPLGEDNTIAELRQSLEERAAELERLRKQVRCT